MTAFHCSLFNQFAFRRLVGVGLIAVASTKDEGLYSFTNVLQPFYSKTEKFFTSACCRLIATALGGKSIGTTPDTPSITRAPKYNAIMPCPSSVSVDLFFARGQALAYPQHNDCLRMALCSPTKRRNEH